MSIFNLLHLFNTMVIACKNTHKSQDTPMYYKRQDNM
jgi:hypothetical protein